MCDIKSLNYSKHFLETERQKSIGNEAWKLHQAFTIACLQDRPTDGLEGTTFGEHYHVIGSETDSICAIAVRFRAMSRSRRVNGFGCHLHPCADWVPCPQKVTRIPIACIDRNGKRRFSSKNGASIASIQFSNNRYANEIFWQLYKRNLFRST